MKLAKGIKIHMASGNVALCEENKSCCPMIFDEKNMKRYIKHILT